MTSYFIDELDEEIEPFVMASTPAVLSVGRRCLDFGYEFRWPAGKLPYFITPKGVKVTLVVEDYIPYLRTQHAARQVRAVTNIRGKALAGPDIAPPTMVRCRGQPRLCP